MKLPTIHKLHSTGFAHHFLLPVLAVLVVGGIGAYVLSQGHAATATSYYSSSCIKTTYGPPNSSFQPCALYAQELMNGIQHQKTKSLGLAAYAGSTFKYTDSKYYLLMNGLYGKYTAQAVTAVTGDKNGQLTSGNTGSWQALCTTAASAGLATGGAAASATLKFNLGTDTNATQTNAGVFTNACGSKVSSGGTVNGGAPSTPTTTTSSACTSKTFQSGNKDSGSSHCVQYLQQMFNGINSYLGTRNVSVATVNAEPISTLSSTAAFIVNGDFGSTTNTYDARTVTGVSNFQKWVNSSGTAIVDFTFNMPAATFNKTFKPNGNLPTNGTTDPKTWHGLCEFIANIPTSTRSVTNSTDFTGGKPNSAGSNKTNMWYFRSYMRAGASAASSAGCSV